MNKEEVGGVRWFFELNIHTKQKARHVGILAYALAELYLWDHWIVSSRLLNHLLLTLKCRVSGQGQLPDVNEWKEAWLVPIVVEVDHGSASARNGGR